MHEKKPCLFPQVIILLLSLLLLGSAFSSFAQSANNNDTQWENFSKQYYSGQLNDTQYLKKIDSIAVIFYADKNLKEKLELYKQIAWADKKLYLNRADYYRSLAMNAIVTDRAGSYIYYIQKREEELKKHKPYINSLEVERGQMYRLDFKGSEDTCLSVLKKILPLLEAMPEQIIVDSVPALTVSNAVTILQIASDVYIKKGDSGNIKKITSLMDQYNSSMVQKESRYSSIIDKVSYMLHLTNYLKYFSRKQLVESEKELFSLQQIANTRDDLTSINYWKRYAKVDVLQYFVELYTAEKKNDSASYYLQLLKAREPETYGTIGNGTIGLQLDSKLMANEGDYKKAYEDMSRAFEINDSLIGVKTADINNNMYAQTVAENNKIELDKSEKEKQHETILIFIITFALITGILVLYRLMRKKDKLAKDRIDKLNTASQLQIAELEEKNRIAKQEEQKRLGMELHDDTAANVATIKLLIDAETRNTTDGDQQKRLTNISKLVDDTYKSVRYKSHEWYNTESNETSFSERITSILNKGLPTGEFQQEIIVENNSLQHVALNTKIQLLYIIKEAISNILKHAHAHKITVLIYEDKPGVILHIKDDGKGFAEPTKNKKRGIGLQTIKERTANINGTVDIQSDKSGTAITVTVPVEEIMSNRN